MRIIWLLILVIAGALTGALITRFEQEPPEVHTRTQAAYVGKHYLHEFRVSDDGMGVERVRRQFEGVFLPGFKRISAEPKYMSLENIGFQRWCLDMACHCAAFDEYLLL